MSKSHAQEIDFVLFEFAFRRFKEEGFLSEEFEQFVADLFMQLVFPFLCGDQDVIHVMLKSSGVFLIERCDDVSDEP